MRKLIEKYLNEGAKYTIKLFEYAEDLIEIANILKDASIIYIAGNGGSAATASHMANDFNKMCGLNAICLTDNISTLTAWANDDCYENVFVRQVEDKLVYDEVIIILSGSGNSENLVRLAEWGIENDKYVVAFLGTDGGKLYRMKDIMKIHMDSDQLQTENWHVLLDHLLCKLIKGDENDG